MRMSEEEKLIDQTFRMFEGNNRHSYERYYRNKWHHEPRADRQDYVIRLELLLKGMKNDDYTIKEIIILRDHFHEKAWEWNLGYRDGHVLLKDVMEQINQLLIEQLSIKIREE